VKPHDGAGIREVEFGRFIIRTVVFFDEQVVRPGTEVNPERI
jgi:hypothetical protein